MNQPEIIFDLEPIEEEKNLTPPLASTPRRPGPIYPEIFHSIGITPPDPDFIRGNSLNIFA